MLANKHTGQQVARWVTPGMVAEVANCWRHTGSLLLLGDAVKEYWATPILGTPRSVCDCGAGDNVCTIDDIGFLLAGLLATCWVFHQMTFPPSGAYVAPFGNKFYCTGEASPDDPVPIAFRAPWLFNTSIVGLGNGERGWGVQSCTSDFAARCWGHKVAATAGNHSCEPDQWDPADGYYANERDAFNYLQCVGFHAAFAPEGTADQPSLDLCRRSRRCLRSKNPHPSRHRSWQGYLPNRAVHRLRSSRS